METTETTGRRPTWAGLSPEEHAGRVAAKALDNAAKGPAEHREKRQRYRLRVVDDLSRPPDDELFGFFKRPREPEVLERAEPEPDGEGE